MNDNYNLVEEYFMQVDKLFADNEYAQGKKLLEEILEMEPAYGRAHNHLGWLYYAKLDNYEKAEYHYKLAKKFAPEYPSGYINLSYILVETKRYEEAKANAEEALKVAAMNRAIIYNELGRTEELQGNYKDALKHYRNALRLCMNKNELDIYNANIERVKTKVNLFSRKFFLF